MMLVALIASARLAAATAPPGRVEPRSADALVRAWDAGFGAKVEHLLHDGREAAVMQALARHPPAALELVRHLRTSNDVTQRKLAAILVGRLAAQAPAGMLDALFEAEAARDRAATDPADRLDGPSVVNDVLRREVDGRRHRAARNVSRLDAQAVVEDIVFAATRWCGHPERASAGVALLRKVVERTVDGEYWNSSGAALEGLVCHCHADARDLLARFSSYAAGEAPDHPSRPSLRQERNAAQALRAGRCDAIEPRWDRDVPGGAPVTALDQETDAFLELARCVK